MNLRTVFLDTMEIFEKGFYDKEDKRINLKLSSADIEKVQVFLPEDVHELETYKFAHKPRLGGKCTYSCENIDSYTMARNKYYKYADTFENPDKGILVLNLANPVNPGGGVRRGARAQEEDLCRVSSLLLSIESEEAFEYYKYNRSLNTYMGTDGIIITPKVEIIKDADYNLLDETVVVSVMTCAAPMITYGMEGLSSDDYENMVYTRIVGMLNTAAVCGYRHLVLGAFGCGAFSNDAGIVSDLFLKALKNYNLDGMSVDVLFKSIDFAVLSKPTKLYNYEEFYRNFGGDNFNSK